MIKPEVGQAVLELVVMPYMWHKRAREDLRRDAVGIITRVDGDVVTFKHYTGKIKVFNWRIQESMDGTYKLNHIMDWKDLGEDMITLKLAMKYKQSMEDFLKDVA